MLSLEYKSSLLHCFVPHKFCLLAPFRVWRLWSESKWDLGKKKHRNSHSLRECWVVATLRDACDMLETTGTFLGIFWWWPLPKWKCVCPLGYLAKRQGHNKCRRANQFSYLLVFCGSVTCCAHQQVLAPLVCWWTGDRILWCEGSSKELVPKLSRGDTPWWGNGMAFNGRMMGSHPPCCLWGWSAGRDQRAGCGDEFRSWGTAVNKWWLLTQQRLVCLLAHAQSAQIHH